jgi:hypothetical protein
MLQRSSSDSPDDWGVYLEYNDQFNSGYDVVSRCCLSRFRVDIDLSKPLGNCQDITEFELELDIKDSAYECLVQYMRQVFRGKAEKLLVLLAE